MIIDRERKKMEMELAELESKWFNELSVKEDVNTFIDNFING